MSDAQLRIALEWERTLSDLLDRTEKFPKTMRYMLGQRIDETALDVAVLVTDARYLRGDRRRRAIEELNLRLNRLRVLVRIAHQRRCLDHRGYEFVSREIDTFGKGLGAWQKHLDGPTA
jgi:hypothetical protein